MKFLNKVTTLYISLLTTFIFALASCSTQSTIHGLWQDTKEAGTIEFKTNGEIIIIDNMSATVTGVYQLKDNGEIKIELTASDILKESLEPIETTVITAQIVKLTSDELQISFGGKIKIENYKRIH